MVLSALGLSAYDRGSLPFLKLLLKFGEGGWRGIKRVGGREGGRDRENTHTGMEWGSEETFFTFSLLYFLAGSPCVAPGDLGLAVSGLQEIHCLCLPSAWIIQVS